MEETRSKIIINQSSTEFCSKRNLKINVSTSVIYSELQSNVYKNIYIELTRVLNQMIYLFILANFIKHALCWLCWGFRGFRKILEMFVNAMNFVNAKIPIYPIFFLLVWLKRSPFYPYVIQYFRRAFLLVSHERQEFLGRFCWRNVLLLFCTVNSLEIEV